MTATEQEYYERYLRGCAGIRIFERLERQELAPLEKVERLERRLRRLPSIFKARDAYKEKLKKPPVDDEWIRRKDRREGPVRQLNDLHSWDRQIIEPEFGEDYALGPLEHELAIARCELSRAWWEYMVRRRGGTLQGERRLQR